MDHQRGPSHSSKERTARRQMQATTDNHEKENEEADYQAIILRSFLHIDFPPFKPILLLTSLSHFVCTATVLTDALASSSLCALTKWLWRHPMQFTACVMARTVSRNRLGTETSSPAAE